jgi:hypothetical protein
MEILNETVYDDGDIEKFLAWVFEAHHKWSVADYHKRKEAAKAGGHNFFGNEPPKRNLPEKLRIGYYTRKPNKEGDLFWCSVRNGWAKTPRIGIVRVNKLDLNAMEVIARAAAGKDARLVPQEVLACLALRVARTFCGYATAKWGDIIADAPPIRYSHKINRKSAERAKRVAATESLRSAERLVQSLESVQRDLLRKQRAINTDLFKARQRVRSLRQKIQSEVKLVNTHKEVVNG